MDGLYEIFSVNPFWSYTVNQKYCAPFICTVTLANIG